MRSRNGLANAVNDRGVAMAQFASPILRASRAFGAYHVPPRALIGLLGWSSNRHWTPAASHCKRLETRTLYALRHLLQSSRSHRGSHSRLFWIGDYTGVANPRNSTLSRVSLPRDFHETTTRENNSRFWQVRYRLSKLARRSAVDKWSLQRPRFVNKHDGHHKMMQEERDWEKEAQEGEGGRSDGIGGSLVWDRTARREKWEGQRDEEREARLLGLFAVIGGALTR